MPTSQDRIHLFRHGDVSSKLDWFQTLLDSKEITSDEALALLGAIHADLRRPKVHTSSTYMRYAEITESLRRQMPDTFEHVVRTWQEKRAKDVMPSFIAQSTSSSSSIAPAEIWDDVGDESDRASTEHRAGPQQGSQATVEPSEAAAGLAERTEEGEEHGEPEEESEENEHEELQEKEGQEEEEQEEEEKEQDSKEEAEEKNDLEEKQEESDQKEENEEPEAEEFAEVETEEIEKPGIEQSEVGEETESEAEEPSDAGETAAETEPDPSENDRMATEAAEAAHASEEAPFEDIELPGEEEPPIEAAE